LPAFFINTSLPSFVLSWNAPVLKFSTAISRLYGNNLTSALIAGWKLYATYQVEVKSHVQYDKLCYWLLAEVFA